ncbi:MAG: hypothetical protein ACREVA_04985, partial [Burkholderiales bacterium]
SREKFKARHFTLFRGKKREQPPPLAYCCTHEKNNYITKRASWKRLARKIQALKIKITGSH